MQIPLLSCVLRPWQQGDQAALVKYANNILIWNNMRDTFPHPYTLEAADVWLNLNARKYEENPTYFQNFAIEINGEAVGGVGVLPQNDVYRLQAEIGYWLGQPFWGQGIVPQAVQAMKQYAFEQGFIRLFAGVFEHNRPSMRVLEKSGFHLEYVCPKATLKNGVLIDCYYYGAYSTILR